jgi:hypothetical protein
MKNFPNIKMPLVYLIIPLILYSFFAVRNLNLPGLYMDSVNPDYLAAWLIRGDKNIPAWLYPDNLLAAYEFPILNSLYGGNATAYFGLIFFALFGFGLTQVHLYHAFFGLILLTVLFWTMKKWRLPQLIIIFTLSLLAVDPTFIFAWRTQYYLQLFPCIFFIMGLGFLGMHYEQLITTKINHIKYLFISGLLLGFAAYSYFIFFFYAFAVTSTYSLNNNLYSKITSISNPLIFGFFVGWSPYIFAHISLISNTNLYEYIQMLKGLQTAYGVIDNTQHGFISKITMVGDRLRLLLAGHSIESLIFGNSQTHKASIIFSSLIYLFGLTTTLIYLYINRLKRYKKNIYQRHYVLSLILLIIIFVHMIFGFLIGRSLGLQHYIMLLPVIYLLIAVGCSQIRKSIAPYIALTYLIGSLFLITIIFNFTLTNRLSSRLSEEGGSAMYSDVINNAAAYINTLPADTVLFFPQWGYWMGAVTILGPKFDVLEAASLEELQSVLLGNKNILMRNSFAILTDEKPFDSGNQNNYIKINIFVNKFDLEITEIVKFEGRNQKDKLSLILLKKK